MALGLWLHTAATALPRCSQLTLHRRALPCTLPQVRLYALRNGQQLSTKAVANFTRSELATALRKVRAGVLCKGLGLEMRACMASFSALWDHRLHSLLGAPNLLCACPTSGTAQSPYHTNLLMAGFDEGSGPSLYWCDYLATLHHMNICGTGYGALWGRAEGACCCESAGPQLQVWWCSSGVLPLSRLLCASRTGAFGSHPPPCPACTPCRLLLCAVHV